jgi:hypothetical protein
MQIDRAKQLAEEYGRRLSEGVGYNMNLYDGGGRYIDTLHQKQILELDEDDFLEFYLDVFPRGDDYPEY